MRIFTSLILSLIIGIYILHALLTGDLNNLFGTTPATFFAPLSDACVCLSGNFCFPPYLPNGIHSPQCSYLTAPNICCEPEPACDVETCGGWVEPFDTCSANNDSRNCTYSSYSGGGPCLSRAAPTQYMTTNNCGGPHVCQGGVCIPWCTTFTCGAWTTPANTC
ncbi:MAG TPA: hypothetical protein VNZ45_04750, partial [Bacteroidia bacterium]|nr:hypothetical protein [Bacteroidia bacterium]